MMWAGDGAEALVFHFLLREQVAGLPGRLRLEGLDPEAHYCLSLVWPGSGGQAAGPALAAFRSGILADGASLMHIGLQLPRLAPQSGFIAHLERQAATTR